MAMNPPAPVTSACVEAASRVMMKPRRTSFARYPGAGRRSGQPTTAIIHPVSQCAACEFAHSGTIAGAGWLSA
jgi:hypothetical protein